MRERLRERRVHPLLAVRRRGAGASAIPAVKSLRDALHAACAFQLKRWPGPLEFSSWGSASLHTVDLARAALLHDSRDPVESILVVYERWCRSPSPQQTFTAAVACRYVTDPRFELTGDPGSDSALISDALSAFFFDARDAEPWARQIISADSPHPLDADRLWINSQVISDGQYREDIRMQIVERLAADGHRFGEYVSRSTIDRAFSAVR
jgi:hypothetical protein